MIVFKNESGFVEWDTITNTIICNWITVSRTSKMDEVIQAIIEIRNENKIINYVSNRSQLIYNWSGIKEWKLFQKNDESSNKKFKNIFVIDPKKESNQVLFGNLKKIFNFKSYKYTTFKSLKVYQSLSKSQVV